MFPFAFSREMRQALRAGLAVASIAVVLFSFAPPANAQITVENLLSKSIPDISDAMAKPVQQAITLFTERKFDDARNLLKQTRQSYPELPPPGVLMAQMFVTANQGLAARMELERCVINDPGDPEPYLVFGDLAFQNRQFTESGLCFEKANELVAGYNANPRRKRDLQIRAYAGLAAVASAREQYTLEEDMLKKWISIEPDSTAAYTRLARCQFKQGGDENIRTAYATFKKLYDEIDTEKDPAKKVPRPEVNMAVMYSQAKDLKDAEALAKKLMSLALERAEATDINTRLAVAQWALERGDLTTAKQAAAAAEQIDPDSLQALLLNGVAARYGDDLATAEKYFRKALSIAPSNFAAMNNLALTLAAQPDQAKRKQALEFAQVNQRVNNDLRTPAGREAAATLAWATYRTGNEQAAEQGMVQILRSGSVSNEAGFLAAKVLHERGRSEARPILENLVKQEAYFPGKDEAQTMLNAAGSGDLLPTP